MHSQSDATENAQSKEEAVTFSTDADKNTADVQQVLTATVETKENSSLNKDNYEKVGCHPTQSSTTDILETTTSSAFSSSVNLIKKEGKVKTPNVHKVTFTVTISLALSALNVEKDLNEKYSKKPKEDKKSKTKPFKSQDGDIPVPKGRQQRFYHLEYTLLPGDDPTQIDVLVAEDIKIFFDKEEPQFVKPWSDEELSWISWSHNHKLVVCDDVLLQLFKHTLELRIWDSKEKLSQRSRIDRSKFPDNSSPENNEEDLKLQSIVLKQVESYKRLYPRKEETYFSESPAQTLKCASSRVGSLSQPLGTVDRSVDVSGVVTVHLIPSVEPLKRHRCHNSAARKIRKKPGKSKSVSKSKITRKASKKQPGGDKKSPPGNKKETKALADFVRKNGLCTIPVKLSYFFSDKRSVTNRLSEPVSDLGDLFITVSLDKCLLSTSQVKRFNPLTIKVISAKNMPYKPLLYEELKERCLPVHFKYTCFKRDEHVSESREHKRNIYWNDTNVILTGLLDPSEVHEFFSGPPMEIKIYDRNRKPEKKNPKPLLFGDALEDEKFSNVGTVASKRTVNNPFTDRDNFWDPYGVARLDMSGLTLGQKFICQSVPILNCQIPDIFAVADGKLVGVPGAIDGPAGNHVPPGNYLQCGSLLKVVVKLVYPLTTPQKLVESIRVNPAIQCPFGRLVLKCSHQKKNLIQEMIAVIDDINAKALGIVDVQQHVIAAVLSTYKLSLKQKKSTELDIITGFHVADSQMHLIVVEGLQNKGIKKLVDNFGNYWSSDVLLLHNTDLTFSERLYASLDVEICKIKLHEPLSFIMQEPLLYIRDMLPRACFTALVDISELLKMSKLINIVRNNLFPTENAVKCLSKEFGVPVIGKILKEMKSMEKLHEGVKSTEKECITEMKKLKSSDFQDQQFLDTLSQRKQADIQSLSDRVHKARQASGSRVIRVDTTPVHNYGQQTFNSVQLAKAKLKLELAKDPDTFYTYCKDYHSHTVILAELDELQKQELEASRQLWMTKRGWTSPGFRTVLECHTHRLKPSEARINELKLPFRSARQMEDQKKLKFVVSDTNQHYHRCLMETELKPRGLKASNQLEKLKGLLKDPPKKHALKLYRYACEIPALGVVSYPGLDCALQKNPDLAPYEGKCALRGFNPGPFLDHSVTFNNNHIPVADYEHKRFSAAKGHDFRFLLAKTSSEMRRLGSLRMLTALTDVLSELFLEMESKQLPNLAH